jgi:hypothetical protein
VTDLLTRDFREEGTGGDARPPLRVRGPAYGVIAECLRIQADARSQSTLATLFGASPLSPDARSWYRGAIAQIDVVRTLSALGPRWTLLHAEPGTSDIDYLVVGPGGVFTVTTKNHSGQRVRVHDEQLLVNDHRTNHLRDARFEAGRVSKLLSTEASESITVNPLIAIVDPGSLAFGRRRPRDVTVAASSHVGRILARQKRVLADETVDELVATAERGRQWHADGRVIDDTLRHEPRFARLRHEVDAASRRRASWLLLAALALLATAVLLYFA